MKLRLRIPLVILSLSVIPMVLIGVSVYRFFIDLTHENEREHLTGIAVVQAAQLRQLLNLREELFLKELPNNLVSGDQFLHTSSRLMEPGTFPRGALGFGLYDSGGRLVNHVGAYSFSYQMSRYLPERPYPGSGMSPGMVVELPGSRHGVLSLLGIGAFTLATVYPVLDKDLQILAGGIRFGRSGYGYITDISGTIVAHPDSSRPGTPTENSALAEILTTMSNGYVTDFSVRPYSYRGINKILAYRPIPGSQWVLAIVKELNEVLDSTASLMQLLFTLMGFLALTSIILTFHILRKIFDPLDHIRHTAREVLVGNLDVRSKLNSGDEITELAADVDAMIDSLQISLRNVELQELELAHSENRYKLALDGVRDAVWEWLPQRSVFLFSSQIKAILGEEVGTELSFDDFVNNLVHVGDQDRVRELFTIFTQGKDTQLRFDFRAHGPNDIDRCLLVRGVASRGNSGNLVQMLGSLSDVTELREQEIKIHHLAYFDALTGLPNRESFLMECRERLDLAERSAARVAVAMINVNRFRRINDCFGHAFGDEVLKRISTVMESFVKKEHGVLYRHGGDGFIVLSPLFDDQTDFEGVVGRLLSYAAVPMDIEGRSLTVTLSAGISFYPLDGNTAIVLMRNADSALHVARAQGRGQVSCYHSELLHTLNRRIHVEGLLREAIRRKSLVLYYQPLVDLRTGRLAGFEALARLPDGHSTMVSPAEFISIAEETGIIDDLGMWAIFEAIEQYLRWTLAGLNPGFIAVNVSAMQLRNKNFAQDVIKLLNQANIPTGALELEITESAIMDSGLQAQKNIDALRARGINIALDDFGTGYSSLTYLKDIPCQKLKMDHGFVWGTVSDPRQKAVAKGIVEIAHSIGLSVVAEGIETQEALEVIAGLGCQYVQGFMLGRPLPASELFGVFDDHAFSHVIPGNGLKQ